MEVSTQIWYHIQFIYFGVLRLIVGANVSEFRVKKKLPIKSYQ